MTSTNYELPFNDVSDTAYLVANFRLNEARRKDALFNDLLAEKLLGEKGKNIALNHPYSQFGEWMMSMRTWGIDQLLLQAIEKKGVDTILNLAVGLDTRPYRLPFPADTLWVEVDFPGIINHREKQLKNEIPHCVVKRMAVDLSNDLERNKMFDQVEKMGKNILVITEGLLYYLEEKNVEAMAKKFSTSSSYQWWLMDFMVPDLFHWSREHWRMDEEEAKKNLIEGEKKVSFRFLPGEGFDYFSKCGAKVDEFLSFYHISKLTKRPLQNYISQINDEEEVECVPGIQKSGVTLFKI